MMSERFESRSGWGCWCACRTMTILSVGLVASVLQGAAVLPERLQGIEDSAVDLSHPSPLVVPEDLDLPATVTVAATLPHIKAVRFPVLAGHRGNPWSHWGRGLLHSNGRHYLAQGSHTSLNGISVLFEFDPLTGINKAVADLWQPFDPWPSGLPAVEHGEDKETAFGFGKVHGRLSEASDGRIYFASYYGHASRNSRWFYGDRLFRFDPESGVLDDLGRPHPGYGFASTHMDSGRDRLYIEAFARKGVSWGDPERNYLNPLYADPKDPYQVKFMVHDVRQNKTILVGEHPHDFGRDLFVDAAGNAYFNAGEGMLRKYDADSGRISTLDVRMPGNNIRRTAIDRNGTLYGALLDTRVLFAFDPVAQEIRQIAVLLGDAASLAVDPAGRYAYYLPGSHSARAGAPLVRVDLSSGAQQVVALLAPLIRDRLDLHAGGSLSGVIDPAGRTLYLTLHAGSRPDFRFEDELLLIVDLETVSIREDL